ncbi:hypothetical protein [Neptunicella sp. SCSIO 80796]|uniref:hypothetical protein n=1 Tax=Neptunicella plasticusilytica TaxID=3117012 RepID=UPI003A4D4593
MEFTIENERLISESNVDVYLAIENELRNITSWSKPYIKIESREPHIPLYNNQIIWLYIGIFKFPKMEMKIINAEPLKGVSVEYINGDFTGSGEFQLNEIKDETKVTFSWNTKANSKKVKVLSTLLPIKKIHFMVVNLVLNNLERYLINERK